MVNAQQQTRDAGSVSRLIALGAATGHQRRQTAIGQTAQYGQPPIRVDAATPLDNSTTAFVVGPAGRGDRRLLLIDTTAGKAVWEHPLGDLPAVVAGLDGMVVVLSGNELRGYQGDSGAPAWTTTVSVVDHPPEQTSGDMLVDHGQLYLATDRLCGPSPHKPVRSSPPPP